MIDAGAADGLSMPGLIKATKAKQSSVWQWFNAPPGKKTTEKVRAEYLVRAAAYVGTTVEYLVTGKNAPSSQSARLDEAKLTSLLETVESAIVKSKRKVSAKRKAKILASLYADETGMAAATAEAMLTSILSSVEEV